MRKLISYSLAVLFLFSSQQICMASQDGWSGPEEIETSFPLVGTIIAVVSVAGIILLAFRDSERSQRKKDEVKV